VSAHEQNLALPHVARRDLPTLWRALDKIGVATPNVNLVSDIIACPGLDYCSLANARSIPIAQELTRRLRQPRHRQPDRESCTSIFPAVINACGHHHVGHIGILASRRTARNSIRSRSAARADEHAVVGTLIGPAVP